MPIILALQAPQLHSDFEISQGKINKQTNDKWRFLIFFFFWYAGIVCSVNEPCHILVMTLHSM